MANASQDSKKSTNKTHYKCPSETRQKETEPYSHDNPGESGQKQVKNQKIIHNKKVDEDPGSQITS